MLDKRSCIFQVFFQWVGSSFSRLCVSILQALLLLILRLPLIARPHSDRLAAWRTPDHRTLCSCLFALAVALTATGTAEPRLPSDGEPQGRSPVSPRRGCNSHEHRTRRYLQHGSKRRPVQDLHVDTVIITHEPSHMSLNLFMNTYLNRRKPQACSLCCVVS